MFTFKITGLQDALDLLDMGWPTKTVTVIQRGANVYPRDDTHIVVAMSDVGDPKMSPDAPHPRHLRSILAHTANLTDQDMLLVNCWAGQSRSTAAALAILIQHGCTPQEALDRVVDERPVALPNVLFVKHIDKYFGLKGELNKIVKAFIRSELAKPYIRNTTPSAESVDEMKRLMSLFGD
jgi:predicted protein tyrosine phosphatase